MAYNIDDLAALTGANTAVGDQIELWDASAAQNKKIAISELLIGLGAVPSAGGTLTGLLKGAKSTDIASATTTDLNTATGNLVHITGTTTITSFGTVTAGTLMAVVFDGILILTYNVTTMILPAAANITTAAGDSAIFESEGGGNWKCIAYQRASGASLAGQGSGTPLATPSTIASRDASGNTAFNNIQESYTTTATAAGTTTLLVGSTALQYFTGSTTQTVVVPVVSTLALGLKFKIVNLSSGIVTIQSSGLNSILALPALSTAIVSVILITGTTAASWSVESWTNAPSAGASIGGAVTSGTTGSILFVDPTAILAQDNANLFWDNTNNRLGIGQPIPTARLHIKGEGATSATTALLVQNSADNTSLLIKDDRTTIIYARTEATFSIDGGTNSRNGIRLLQGGNGEGYIDGFTEGTSKGTNYALVFGSRANRTGTNITNATTEENGSNSIFGYFESTASAQVQVNSTTRGFLPPRMTTTQKNAIGTPAAGLMVYDTTLNKLCVFTTAWETITSA